MPVHPEAIWCPIAGKLGNSYQSGCVFKDVLHTTEAKGLYRYNPSNYFGHTNIPHATIDTEKICQHVDTSRSSYALVNKDGGVETNRSGVIQVELMWAAGDGPNIPTELLDRVRSWLDWSREMHGTLPVAWDDFHYYPPENGIRLGYEPWRIPYDEWNRWGGLCGHQHVPENSHGDPGKIPIASLISSPPLPPKDVVKPMYDPELPVAASCAGPNGLGALAVSSDGRFWNFGAPIPDPGDALLGPYGQSWWVPRRAATIDLYPGDGEFPIRWVITATDGGTYVFPARP